jgi:hypothetical protein
MQTPNNLPASDILLIGMLRIVALARDSKGHAHALAYLEAECPAKDKKSLMHTMRVLCDLGEAATKQESFRHEAGPIHALKSFQARVACFREGNVWFLTHGFTKKKDKWSPAEMERALRIMAEHLARSRKSKR